VFTPIPYRAKSSDHGFRNPLQQNLEGRHHLLAKAHLGRAIHIDQMNEGFGSGGSDFGPPMRPALAPRGRKVGVRRWNW